MGGDGGDGGGVSGEVAAAERAWAHAPESASSRELLWIDLSRHIVALRSNEREREGQGLAQLTRWLSNKNAPCGKNYSCPTLLLKSNTFCTEHRPQDMKPVNTKQTAKVSEPQVMAKDSASQALPAGPSLPISHC